jgi:hypothetical protein
MVEIAALLDFLVLLAISPFRIAPLLGRNRLVMAFVTTSTPTTPRSASTMVAIAALPVDYLVLLAISPFHFAWGPLLRRNSLVMAFVKALTMAVSITTPDVDMTAGTASKGIDCDAPKRRTIVAADG